MKRMFSFLPIMNSLVTIGWSLVLLIKSAIISSNAINIFCFFPGFVSVTLSVKPIYFKTTGNCDL